MVSTNTQNKSVKEQQPIVKSSAKKQRAKETKGVEHRAERHAERRAERRAELLKDWLLEYRCVIGRLNSVINSAKRQLEEAEKDMAELEAHPERLDHGRYPNGQLEFQYNLDTSESGDEKFYL
jgi:hypothetical protein